MAVKAILATGICFASFCQASASQPSYCPARMEPAQKTEIFSRVMILGASFSHGCPSCDIDEKRGTFLRLSDDDYWMRRHPLLYFLRDHIFPGQTSSISVFENDPTYDFSKMLPAWQVSKNGYSGLWRWHFDNNQVTTMSEAQFDDMPAGSAFKAAVPLLGGLPLRRTDTASSRKTGIVYSADSANAAAASPFVIYDLAVDNGRMQDLFRYAGDKNIYNALEKSEWMNAADREKMIQKTASRLNEFTPTSIFAFDALFWDAIAHAFSVMQKNHPSNPSLAFLLNVLKKSGQLNEYFSDTRNDLVLDSWLDTMRRVSLQGPHQTPIFIGRLMTGTDTVFHNNAKGISAFVADFLLHQAGQNFYDEIYEWITKMAYEENTRGAKILRRIGYFENGRFHPLKEIREFQRLLDLDDEGNPLSGTPRQGAFPRHEKVVGEFVTRLLAQLPSFVDSVKESFDGINAHVEDYISRTNAPMHLLNAEKFYSHFPEYLKPETFHPDIQGAQRIADVVEASMCE